MLWLCVFTVFGEIWEFKMFWSILNLIFLSIIDLLEEREIQKKHFFYLREFLDKNGGVFGKRKITRLRIGENKGLRERRFSWTEAIEDQISYNYLSCLHFIFQFLWILWVAKPPIMLGEMSLIGICNDCDFIFGMTILFFIINLFSWCS